MLIGRLFSYLDDKIFSLSWPLPLVLVVVLIAIWVVFEFSRKIFDISGTMAFFVMGVIVLWTTKTEGLFLLLFAFECSVVAKKFYMRSAGCFGNTGNFYIGIGVSQVLARGLMALLSALMWYVTGSLSSLVMFGASIAESCSDSLASSIGSLSKIHTVSIRNFMPVPKGYSGGITPLGIFSSLIASLAVGLLWIFLFLDVQEYNTAKCIALCSVISLTGFMGSIVDSYLGACVQAHYINPKTKQLTEDAKETGKESSKEYAKDDIDFELSYGLGWVDNDMVNLLSNIFSAVFSLGMALLLV